jgi:hypothetical protein
MLSIMLPVRAGMLAALDAILHAMGVLPLHLHNLLLLFLRLFPNLSQWAAPISQRI